MIWSIETPLARDFEDNSIISFNLLSGFLESSILSFLINILSASYCDLRSPNSLLRSLNSFAILINSEEWTAIILFLSLTPICHAITATITKNNIFSE